MHKRIIIIANYKESAGGISGQVKLLHDNLVKDGVKADIYSTKGSFLKRIFLFIKLLFIGNKYDVYHIHACSEWGFLPAVFGISIGKLLGKRIILTYHGGGAKVFFSKHTKFARFFLLRTDHNIVLSGFLGTIFDKYSIPYTVIPNILEQSNIAPFNKRTISARFISVRTLQPLYNIGCILKAFKIVQGHVPDASLIILGDGESRKKLEQFVNDNNLDNIEFTGFIPNTEVLKKMGEADILLSAPKIDNQPMSILEAFKAGLLVISSNVGGVPYMIQDGVNGLLFESDNPADLAEKMLWAINHKKESIKMILNGRDSLTNYTWARISDVLYSLYE